MDNSIQNRASIAAGKGTSAEKSKKLSDGACFVKLRNIMTQNYIENTDFVISKCGQKNCKLGPIIQTGF